MNEKILKAKQKQRNRQFDTHVWWLKTLTYNRNLANYKYEKFKADYERLSDEIKYATAEYMQGIITKEEMGAIKMQKAGERGRKKKSMATWKDRVKYLDILIEIEDKFVKEAVELKGVKDYIIKSGRGRDKWLK